MSEREDYDDAAYEMAEYENHPSDIYCGVCGLDYPCGGPCDSTAIYNPPADYLTRKVTP